MYVRRLLDIKRFSLISPELMLALFILWLHQTHPSWFESVAIALREGDGLPGYIGGLPFALVLASYKLGVEILRPGDEDTNKELYEWPMYWAIEARVYGSIFLCASCCVAAALFYLDPFEWPASMSGAMVVGAVLVSTTTVFTLFVGKMQLRKLMTLYR